jgi:hypothetical protein
MYWFIFIVIVLSAIAMWLFQYMNQKRKIRQEEMHERKRQQFEELLKLIGDRNPADGGPSEQGSDSSSVPSGQAGTNES